MSPIILVDGNNLGHVLGYIDKTSGHYDVAGLLTCLDGVARYLAYCGQEVEIVLFLDDVSASERRAGWYVHVAPSPHGDADAAIRAYAQAHADRLQTLVSGDHTLCDDVALSRVLCLSPADFGSRYLVPARDAGFVENAGARRTGQADRLSYASAIPGTGAVSIEKPPAAPPEKPVVPGEDQGDVERRRQREALERTQATLRGELLAAPEVYRLDLTCWRDTAELALYLAEHHLCPGHGELTDPGEMLAAIREHCCLEPRYFTSGRVIDRVFRLFLCRPEHTLSLDDLVRMAGTRRRKIRAAIDKYGERLGIVVKW